MLSPQEIESLSQRICPNCENTVTYDKDYGYLTCDLCNRHWDYTEYKQAKLEYFENPNGYTTVYYHEKLSR